MNISKSQIFLLDGIGACTSAIMLGIVLVKFQGFFGMPKIVLFMLSGIAVLLMIYSLSCFFLLRKGHAFFLRIIAVLNLLYCFLTAVLVFLYLFELTVWGLLYFLGEMMIVLLLARFEWKKSRHILSEEFAWLNKERIDK